MRPNSALLSSLPREVEYIREIGGPGFGKIKEAACLGETLLRRLSYRGVAYFIVENPFF
jgi:hypothetical protein